MQILSSFFNLQFLLAIFVKLFQILENSKKNIDLILAKFYLYKVKFIIFIIN